MTRVSSSPRPTPPHAAVDTRCDAESPRTARERNAWKLTCCVPKPCCLGGSDERARVVFLGALALGWAWLCAAASGWSDMLVDTLEGGRRKGGREWRVRRGERGGAAPPPFLGRRSIKSCCCHCAAGSALRSWGVHALARIGRSNPAQSRALTRARPVRSSPC